MYDYLIMKLKLMYLYYILYVYECLVSGKLEKGRFIVCSDINPNGDHFNHVVKQLCIQYITMCTVRMRD